jgi:hypothetical protein
MKSASANEHLAPLTDEDLKKVKQRAEEITYEMRKPPVSEMETPFDETMRLYNSLWSPRVVGVLYRITRFVKLLWVAPLLVLAIPLALWNATFGRNVIGFGGGYLFTPSGSDGAQLWGGIIWTLLGLLILKAIMTRMKQNQRQKWSRIRYSRGNI